MSNSFNLVEALKRLAEWRDNFDLSFDEYNTAKSIVLDPSHSQRLTLIADMESVVALYEDVALSLEEFTRVKASLLNINTSIPQSSSDSILKQLQDLAALYEAGHLNELEYARAKSKLLGDDEKQKLDQTDLEDVDLSAYEVPQTQEHIIDRVDPHGEALGGVGRFNHFVRTLPELVYRKLPVQHIRDANEDELKKLGQKYVLRQFNSAVGLLIFNQWCKLKSS